jgi:hypothetical protein
MRRFAILLYAILALVVLSASSVVYAATPITYTYNLLSGSCTASRGACKDLSVHAVCGQDLSFSQIAQNNAALRDFNAEAQRHTRPVEAGYAGGNFIPGGRGAGDAYPDASISNMIVLEVPACNKLQYTWNSFTMLIRNIRVSGSGSGTTVLQNISNEHFHADVAGRATYDFFGDTFYGVVDHTYPTDAYGYLIETANLGATQVKLKSAADARNFYLGRWVLVMSYIQDSVGSYPPNMRYYDFAKVTKIDKGKGTIDLDTPLAFDHLANRPYSGTKLYSEASIAGNGTGAGIVGPARIVNIDTPIKPVTEHFELNGIHFLRNPRSDKVNPFSDGWEFTGIIDAKADDLEFDGALDTAEMKNFTLTNSKAFYEEADKIIASATYINDTFLHSLLHSGQLRWHATGGTYGVGEVSCAALVCIIDGGAVLTAAQSELHPHPGIELDRLGFTNMLSLDNVVFKGSGALGNAAINAWHGPRYTIGSAGFSVQDGANGPNTRLVISKCVRDPVDCTDLEYGGTVAQEVAGTWGDGSTLIRGGVLEPGATITAITGDGRNLYVDVKGAHFRPGESVYFSRVRAVSVTNSRFLGIGNDCEPSNGPTGCIRFPGGLNIPHITWSGNTGG